MVRMWAMPFKTAAATGAPSASSMWQPGKVINDVVQWARITQIAWANDGSGFYYSRYPGPKPGAADASVLINHAVYFHRIGTPQTDDTLFFATPSKPGRLNSAGLTADGRYAIIYSSDDLVHADVLVVRSGAA